MSDYWRGFKQQPWTLLTKIAGTATAIALAIDLLLWVAFTYDTSLNRLFDPANPLIFSVLSLLPLIAGVGFGALGVTLCERWPNGIYLNTPRLWALVLCLLGGLLIKTLLPIPLQLVQLSQGGFIGVVVGVFGKGRPYWGRWG
ncbi:MAG: peptide chain release factor 1 [Spirulina sp.]